jgi:hypothetical protein
MLRLTRRSLTAAGLAATLPASMAWSQDAPPVRVRGTIERIESPVFLVKEHAGKGTYRKGPAADTRWVGKSDRFSNYLMPQELNPTH